MTSERVTDGGGPPRHRRPLQPTHGSAPGGGNRDRGPIPMAQMARSAHRGFRRRAVLNPLSKQHLSAIGSIGSVEMNHSFSREDRGQGRGESGGWGSIYL